MNAIHYAPKGEELPVCNGGPSKLEVSISGMTTPRKKNVTCIKCLQVMGRKKKMANSSNLKKQWEASNVKYNDARYRLLKALFEASLASQKFDEIAKRRLAS